MKDSLRRAAGLARERMKYGYGKENFSEVSQNKTVFVPNVNVEDDPVFRAKVRYIIENEEQILNPIRLLVEGDAFEKADSAKRQKIIFETAERFRKVREELEKQKS